MSECKRATWVPVAGMIAILGWSLFASPRSEAASRFRIVLDAPQLSESERQAVEELVSKVEQILPGKVKDAIGGEVRLRFRKFESLARLELPSCGEAPRPEGAPSRQTLGQTLARTEVEFLGSSDKTIVLNELLLPEIVAGEQGARTYPCGHKSAYRLAAATLIHELGHVYDHSGPMTATEKQLVDFCDDRRNDTLSRPDYHRICREASYVRRRVSSRREYQGVSGWLQQGPLPILEQRNHKQGRSPDPSELDWIEEHFAVNLEYFLLDPEYSCRRPTLFSFMLHHFKHQPYEERGCQINFQAPVRLGSVLDPTQNQVPIRLDPSRVYQVHYLMAGQGQSMMSRWGHAMFRLVVCAPSRPSVGPDCLKDIEYHLVVSYRAKISDLKLDAIKGVLGGYPSQLFLLPFAEVIEEYTAGELRDLISLPLEISATDQYRFIAHVFEEYWQYRGDYRFFTNNCATESLWFLRAALRNPAIHRIEAITPLGLLNDLAKAGIIDKKLIEDEAAAQEAGYLFKSKHADIEKTFRNIQRFVRAESLEDYLAKTRPFERKVAYLKAVASMSARDRKQVAASFAVLERQIGRMRNKDLQVAFQAMIEEESKQSEAASDRVKQAVVAFTNPPSPWDVKPGGYGIPLERELSAHAQAEKGSSFAQLYDEALAKIRSREPARFSELDAIKQNLSVFNAGVRQK